MFEARKARGCATRSHMPRTFTPRILIGKQVTSAPHTYEHAPH